jgi:hypothetical protein
LGYSADCAKAAQVLFTENLHVKHDLRLARDLQALYNKYLYPARSPEPLDAIPEGGRLAPPSLAAKSPAPFISQVAENLNTLQQSELSRSDCLSDLKVLLDFWRPFERTKGRSGLLADLE